MDNSSESSQTQESEFPSGLNERYDIERKIGEGGFAETFLAHDRKTGTRCVLKILSWKEVDDWKTIELFEREARVLSQIDHPQIPRFIEFFTHKTGSETKIVLVQEYIPGKNLAQLIQEGKRYTEKEAIQLALHATKILEYLHNFSPPIIHRDIKSSNLLLSENEELHL
ncbi:MAG: serine/threonine protein kinase, partial [Acidobacteriota bacterium]